MKLLGNTKLMIPAWDEDGGKNWLMMTFRGDVDHRRLRRETQRWLKNNYNVSASKEWMRLMCRLVRLDGPDLTQHPDFNQVVENYIQRMQADEDQDEGHTSDQSSDAGGSELAVPSVPSEPETRAAPEPVLGS